MRLRSDGPVRIDRVWRRRLGGGSAGEVAGATPVAVRRSPPQQLLLHERQNRLLQVEHELRIAHAVLRFRIELHAERHLRERGARVSWRTTLYEGRGDVGSWARGAQTVPPSNPRAPEPTSPV